MSDLGEDGAPVSVEDADDVCFSPQDLKKHRSSVPPQVRNSLSSSLKISSNYVTFGHKS